MTIKKPMKAPMTPQAEESSAVAPAVAGATIADRFKLDAPDPDAKPKKSGGGIGATIAVIAGLLALGIAGTLTFIIYQHWEFLKGA